jgi:hypothetical protein
LTNGAAQAEQLEVVDNLVVKSFTQNFNEAYGDLLPEQKELLNRFITSFNENEVDFKLYMGQELQRIKEAVEASLSMAEVKEDAEMVNSTNRVVEQLNTFNVAALTESQILKILKLQKLVREYETDANNN